MLMSILTQAISSRASARCRPRRLSPSQITDAHALRDMKIDERDVRYFYAAPISPSLARFQIYREHAAVILLPMHASAGYTPEKAFAIRTTTPFSRAVDAAYKPPILGIR